MPVFSFVSCRNELTNVRFFLIVWLRDSNDCMNFESNDRTVTEISLSGSHPEQPVAAAGSSKHRLEIS